MKKILLQITLLFIVTILKSQAVVYPYFRVSEFTGSKEKLVLTEDRASATDVFKPSSRIDRTFSANCVIQKTVLQKRNPTSGLFVEENRDSLTYENGFLKSFVSIRPEYTTVNTFSRSKDAKNDTLLSVQKLPNNLTESYRSILYRNQKGLDSVFLFQSLKAGVWKNFLDYIEIFYDAQSRVTQVKTSSDAAAGLAKKNITVYNYTNNKVVSKIDTIFSTSSNGTTNVTRAELIYKADYTYNAKGVVSEVINSYWDLFNGQPQSVLILYSRFRNTAFNAKDKVTFENVDLWANGSWSEIARNETTYINDTIVTKINEYSSTNNTWWIKKRGTFEYCGVVNSLKDVPTLDFNIAPNPTQNIINITSSEIVDAHNKVFIFNSSGVQVLQKNDVTLPASVDLGLFSEGMYFMKFVDSKGVSEIKKFLVVR
jgi:Secretion system C-terminal sorting domain